MSNGKSEDMLAQLIRMVGSIQPVLDEMKSEITEMKSEIAGVKSEIAEMKSEIAEMKSEIAEIKSEIAEMKSEIAEIKTELKEVNVRQAQFELKSEDRHQEVLRAIHALKADQDYIWQKAVRNEREIEKMKNQ